MSLESVHHDCETLNGASNTCFAIGGSAILGWCLTFLGQHSFTDHSRSPADSQVVSTRQNTLEDFRMALVGGAVFTSTAGVLIRREARGRLRFAAAHPEYDTLPRESPPAPTVSEDDFAS